VCDAVAVIRELGVVKERGKNVWNLEYNKGADGEGKGFP
jgi:hypothetical protein